MAKRICIIGASAGVGLAAVRVALERGHQVVSLSRSVATLPDHPQLTKIQGSATSVDDLRRAVSDADAVLVCLGTGIDTKPTTLYTDFGKALLSLQAELGDTPLLVLTGFGAGESGQFHGPVMRLVFRYILKDVYANKTALESMVTASGLNWMLVRPGLLTNGASNGTGTRASGLPRWHEGGANSAPNGGRIHGGPGAIADLAESQTCLVGAVTG